MTQGFPKHITRLAAHAARVVHAYGIVNDDNEPFHYGGGEIGGYYYQPPSGPAIPIPAFAKFVRVDEAFNEVLAASWGEALHCPVAPVAFDRDNQEDVHVIQSFSAFTHTVTAQTVFQKSLRGNAAARTSDNEDMDSWSALVDAAGAHSNIERMQQVLFSRTKSSISRLIPFMNWIGGGDPDISNMIIDRDGLLHAIAHKTSPKPVGLYMCDFTDSQLAYGFTDAQTPVIDTELNRAPLCNLATFLDSWPSVASQHQRLLNTDGKDGNDYDDEDIMAPHLNPVFAPHLDFLALRQTMQHIASFDDTLIRDEMHRIAEHMAQILHEPEAIAKLHAYAAYKANVLILRRDLLAEHMAPLLAFEGTPKPRGNLFKRLGRVIDKALHPASATPARPRHSTPRKPRTPKPPSSKLEN